VAVLAMRLGFVNPALRILQAGYWL
jgi:hypothetical protein